MGEPGHSSEVAYLRKELAELRADFERLRAAQASDSPPLSELRGHERTADTASAQMSTTTSRRQLLQRGGLAVGAGLAAATVATRPASAANGDNIAQGSTTTGTTRTELTSSVVDVAAFQANNTAATGTSHGVAGVTNSSTGAGVAGFSLFGAGANAGVYGQTSSTGGTGVSGLNLATSGLNSGVFGDGRSDQGSGVTGINRSTSGSTVGVWGDAGASPSGSGVFGTGGLFGVFGQSFVGVGGNFQGIRSALLLGSNGVPPAARVDAHATGEIYFDDANDLWLCTVAGSPGTWVKLNGASMNLVSPFRGYDSRFVDGPLTAGQSRVVSVKDAINITTGAVTQTDAIPTDATGVSFNLAITGTTGAGFMSATPGDAATFASASINWSGPGITLNNGTMVTLDANRQLKMFAGGTAGSGSHFIIDVTGFTT